MMNSIWPFMSDFGMIFMLLFWFLAIIGLFTVLKWSTAQFNKNVTVTSL